MSVCDPLGPSRDPAQSPWAGAARLPRPGVLESPSSPRTNHPGQCVYDSAADSSFPAANTAHYVPDGSPRPPPSMGGPDSFLILPERELELRSRHSRCVEPLTRCPGADMAPGGREREGLPLSQRWETCDPWQVPQSAPASCLLPGAQDLRPHTWAGAMPALLWQVLG